MKNKTRKLIKIAITQKGFIKKTIFVLIGVLALQVGLAVTYLYAFHAPKAQEIPVSIIKNDKVDTSSLVKILQEKVGDSLKISEVSSEDEAVKELKNHKTYGAYSVSFPKSELIIATASDKKIADIVVKVITDFDLSYQNQVRQKLALNPASSQLSKVAVEGLTINDIAKLPENDPNGTGLFYVAFSFVFGGYLAAVAINIISSNRSFNHRNALIRSFAFIIYGFVGGLLISYLATKGIKILPTEMFWPIVGIGTLTTTGVALFASSLISIMGTIGTGLVIVLFVILGTPASGGPLPLLLAGDGPWQWLSPYLPTGQAMNAIRQVVYFDGVQLWNYLWLLVSYNVIGFVLLISLGLHRSSFDLIDNSNKKSQ